MFIIACSSQIRDQCLQTDCRILESLVVVDDSVKRSNFFNEWQKASTIYRHREPSYLPVPSWLVVSHIIFGSERTIDGP